MRKIENPLARILDRAKTPEGGRFAPAALAFASSSSRVRKIGICRTDSGRFAPAALVFASGSSSWRALAYVSAASPRRARASAKKSASGFTRYSGPRASVRSPTEVSRST